MRGTNDRLHVLVLCAHGRLYALPREHVIETLRPLPVRHLDGVPPFVTGLAVVRGAPLPVIDLARLLGRHTASHAGHENSPAPGRFVTVRVGQPPVALAVDAVVGLRALPTESLLELPALLGDAGSDAVASIATLDAELLLVLRAARIVPDEILDGLALGVAP
jgi:purine-binding chemotaxis protein CheW